jgi:hypothetical protein
MKALSLENGDESEEKAIYLNFLLQMISATISLSRLLY